MKYDVHLYTVVRVKCSGIEADSYKDAIERAEKDFCCYDSSYHLQQCLASGDAEYAEEIVGALVDVVGDESYNQTAYFDVKNGEYKQQLPEGSGRG